ncbi:MAG: Archaeal PaREP1/PaREP8 family protein [Candidatus Bathyarchaeota archaeon BA1]|nr:MAG: Archaeal PaREP1/PaREP8 family protein [Candidatus Bathyarchaeota archaeon BA1]
MRKYLKDSEDLLAKGDYIQASEKLWGVAAETVNAIAASRDIELRTYADLWRFVGQLRTELKDPEISKLFAAAGTLHQNFYEGHLVPDMVIDYTEAVKQFVEKLEEILKSRWC